jgi:hypothetical protein
VISAWTGFAVARPAQRGRVDDCPLRAGGPVAHLVIAVALGLLLCARGRYRQGQLVISAWTGFAVARPAQRGRVDDCPLRAGGPVAHLVTAVALGLLLWWLAGRRYRQGQLVISTWAGFVVARPA